MVLAIAATFCAAALVLYLQHRAVTAIKSQTQVILRQISEQTATDIALEVRRTLDGPVFDTLTAVNHPELRAGRLDLVAQQYSEGLQAYPHVQRFLVWSAQTQLIAPNEAVFYGRNTAGTPEIPLRGPDLKPFERDPELGRAIMRLAEHYRPSQQIYIAAEGMGPQRSLHVFLRLFWTDARREQYFEVLGFVVDPADMRHELFSVLYNRGLGSLLKRRGGDVPLTFRVTDERNELVFGDPMTPTTVASVPLPMLFYPIDRIDSRLAMAVAPKPWRIQVGAPERGVLASVGQGYWPTVFSVLLMLVALALTVQANRRAAELTRMQSDFISHVTHQLKTPLSLLSAATETVGMDRVRSPEKLGQYLAIIRGEVARLSALVQRILEFSRLQQQRGYEFESVDLGALVRETVAAFESSLSGQCSFRVEEDRSSPHVLADPAAIEQALVNLLDNAVKYSGSASDRTVTVRVRAVGRSAVIEVADNGVGISDSDRRRIFEKFYRGSSGALHRDGFGLGLPIVQELVQAHGGSVEVESTLGHGSTFRITLPLPLASPERAEQPVPMAGDIKQPGTLS
jgi:signal transduction histidine kinase